MKVTVHKGPLFEKVKKEVYKEIGMIIRKKIREESLSSSPNLDYNRDKEVRNDARNGETTFTKRS
ncbi:MULTISPECIES: hypothetical protein [Bacillus]|uniref:hypothetical protein n=1 Tax=Bacillus TaxID=1386 RepID=UPI00037CA929|nr:MULTISPECIES: hypothetical protein [Bacillus]